VTGKSIAFVTGLWPRGYGTADSLASWFRSSPDPRRWALTCTKYADQLTIPKAIASGA
jgi:hypothetical protein